jgi:hypothetical protein
MSALLKQEWTLQLPPDCRYLIFALILHSQKSLYVSCGDCTQREKLDETWIRTSRIGHVRWRSTFDRNRVSNAAGPLGTVPVFERRERCSGLRSARLRPHQARVSARGLRRPPPLCTSRLRIPSGLSSVLILKEGFGLLFLPANVCSKVGLSIEIHKIHDVSVT